jgi:hypothetical protein
MSNLPLRPFIKNDEKIIFGICVLAICSFQVEREIVYILSFLCDRHNSNKTFFSDGPSTSIKNDEKKFIWYVS